MKPHEPQLDPSLALEHLDWVRALARSLVRDAHLAEDVVQETWLAALRRPASDARPSKGWLARVVRNAVLQVQRREATRGDYEGRARSSGEEPATDDLLERVEVQRMVVDAVLELDAPYRRVLLLRYFEGLSPRAIARATDTPVATVKTRLARGLALLRTRLDGRCGGDGKAWVQALGVLIGELPLSGGPIEGASSSAGGVSVMMKGIACIAATVAVAVWVPWSSGKAPREERVAARAPDEGGGARAIASPVAPAHVADTAGREAVVPMVAEDDEAIDARTAMGEASLTIQVVDPRGDPVADVPVRVSSTRLGGGGHSRQERTNEGGEVVVPDLFTALPTLASGYVLKVRLEAALPSPIEWQGDPASLPNAPVRFTLPDTGSLRVDVQGLAAKEEAWVLVVPLVPDEANPGSVRRGQRSPVRTIEGVAWVPHVALGMQLAIEVDPDAATIGAKRTLQGPGATGEIVECTFELERTSPLLVGRLLRPDGSPLARSMVEGEASFATRDGIEAGRLIVRTDDTGAFSAHVETEQPASKFEHLRLGFDERPTLFVELDVRWPTTDEPLDLGEVTLAPAPLLARGTVVDAEGKPVYWAAVRVERKVPWNNAEGFDWHTANEFMCQSARDGSFEMLGTQDLLAGGEFRVFATRSTYLDARPVPLHAGAEDIELVLEKEGEVGGSLLLDEGVRPEWLRVTVRPEGGSTRFSFTGDPGWLPNAVVLSDSRFSIQNLPPGLATVTVTINGQDTVLRAIEDVRVESGRVSTDERLNPIDLRGKLRRVNVDVTDSSGQPIGVGHVAFHVSDDEVRHVLLDASGRATILTHRTSLEVEPFAPGFLTLRTVAVDHLTLALVPAPTVQIRLPERFELPPGVELRAELIAAVHQERRWNEFIEHAVSDRRTQWEQWERAALPAFGDEREVRLPVYATGTHSLAWVVSRGADDPLRSPSRAWIRMRSTLDVDGDLRIERAPDAGELAAAVARVLER